MNRAISLNQIHHALGGEISGGQVLCPGPGHSQQDRSLAVKPADNEDGFVVTSFANDDWRAAKDHVRQKLGMPRFEPRRPHETCYDYLDENGTLRFQVVRGEPKTFRQRRPDGRGGWIWNLQGVERVPYRLPQIIEALANERPVFVVEGEKDADRLWSLNVPATCNPQGAGKWRDEYSTYFDGATVYILPDNDKAGRDHAEQVASSLAKARATTRIVELPGLSERGDVSDWLNAGGTAEELYELAQQADEYKGGGDSNGRDLTDPNPGVVFSRYGTFYLTRDELENWLADAALGQNSPGELPELIIDPHDLPATARDLAERIAHGTDFLFNGNTPVRVTSEDDDMPRAIPVTNEAVRVLAHKLCAPTKVEVTKFGTQRTRVTLPKDIASLYLNGLEGEWGLQLFRGITTAPILSDDGTIRTASGYDPETGLRCHTIPAVTVADRPSQDDAAQALAFIRSTFKTFPFADGERVTDPDLGVEVMRADQRPGLDETSFLVGLMTAVCRPSLELAPGFLCNAPKRIRCRDREGFTRQVNVSDFERCQTGRIHVGT